MEPTEIGSPSGPSSRPRRPNVLRRWTTEALRWRAETLERYISVGRRFLRIDRDNEDDAWDEDTRNTIRALIRHSNPQIDPNAHNSEFLQELGEPGEEFEFTLPILWELEVPPRTRHSFRIMVNQVAHELDGVETHLSSAYNRYLAAAIVGVQYTAMMQVQYAVDELFRAQAENLELDLDRISEEARRLITVEGREFGCHCRSGRRNGQPTSVASNVGVDPAIARPLDVEAVLENMPIRQISVDDNSEGYGQHGMANHETRKVD